MTEQEHEKGRDDVLKEQIQLGYREYQRSNVNLLLSSFTAGLEIGFSILLMGVIYTMYSEIPDPDTLHLLVSLGYPLGFIFVILGKSELYSEETSLAILPVLGKKTTVGELFGRWGMVLLGNLVGGFLFALLITWIGPENKVISKDAFIKLGDKATGGSPMIVFGGAILAGWMMGLLGWLMSMLSDSISKIMIVILITVVVGLAKLPHCIVGSVEVFSSLLVDSSLTVGDYLKFISLAVIGNTVGGAFFVAVLKYSQLEK